MALLLFAVGEVVGIVVAPTAVYLTDRRPAGAVTLYNPSDVPEEVSVETLFGFPRTNADGGLELYTDVSGSDARSAAGWIRALPQRLVVPPGERRTVRLLAQPPADLEDGEYWTRLVFNARGQEIPVDASDTAGIAIGVNLQVRTIISAAFRKGEVTTGVRVEDFEPTVAGDSLIMRPDFVRQGNAAFIGRLQAQLVNSDGAVARSWEEQVAVYREYRRRYAYDISGLPAGTYRFQLRLSTERPDIDPQFRLRAAPAVVTTEVRLD